MAQWRKLRLSTLFRDRYLCQCDECQRGIPLVANQVDHIIPVSKGGSNELDNLRAINSECHKKKTLIDSRE